MMWLLLAGAIITEVTATLLLRVASTGKRRWYVPVAVGYVLAFTLLTLTLDQGMSLGVAYGIWAAAGVALTAVGSRVFFKETITPVMMLGLGLIIGGVLLIELGAAH
ncbi:cation/cationic drug transporter [Pseudarthrobacter phenanthrenivorans Sphe3]|uniref:Cation/cationic drug transporter n=2 Tax=Pseudarthrobacter phenanthrenivorans TaxID=361575 RepID=F0M572_PSEPM|nr:SMR family transporter [Pseudarthrobacter phenanthrenivorans]ADX74592.1 cation/cationic drug transporter [Pseudarthrobacter phenanthrenivorans Sphe3]